ncbi:MAG: GIY-YIG nuclease family protein [Lachnospiraceae bacterium]|jgi:putative endonuclease|nr:GIY-YIG nuclease family protein [Lachnospiraceae bacterium]
MGNEITLVNYAYMLRCADGSLYAGWTNDINKRLLAHQSGNASKYTRTRLPVSLVYYETFETKEEAMSREYAFKHMSKSEKESLIISSNAEVDTTNNSH